MAISMRDLHRLVFGQAHVHQLERAADHENRSHRADDQARSAVSTASRRPGSRSSDPATCRRHWRRRCKPLRRSSAPTPHSLPPVQPATRNIAQVAISVAIAMPLIGFEEVPISPQMRDDTVTNKKPNTSTKIAATRLATESGLRAGNRPEGQQRPHHHHDGHQRRSTQT